MIDRIYTPVRCPGCSKMSVTSLSIRAMERALERDLPILLRCAFDCSEWSATPADRERVQRLLAEHAVVASLPWFRLNESVQSQHRYG